jgi:hypothetical protein
MIGERLLEREGERDALVAAIDSARDGRGRLVVVEGEAGPGPEADGPLGADAAAGALHALFRVVAGPPGSAATSSCPTPGRRAARSSPRR